VFTRKRYTHQLEFHCEIFNKKKNSFLKKIENEEEIFNSLNDLDIVNSSRKTIGVSNFVIPIDEKAYILIGIIII
jgi:hypothetical protein